MRFDDVCSGILCCNSSGSEHRIVPMEGIACDTYKVMFFGTCTSVVQIDSKIIDP